MVKKSNICNLENLPITWEIPDLTDSEEVEWTCTSQNKLIESQATSYSGLDEVSSTFSGSATKIPWRAVDGAMFLLNGTPSVCSCLWYQLYHLSANSLCQNLNLDEEFCS